MLDALDTRAAGGGFHGIFEKLRQLEIAERVTDDLYDEADDNFWNDYCGEDLSDLVRFKRELTAPGLRVLDLACGAGRIGIALAREGAQVDGLERSAAMLGLARRACAAEPREVAGRLQFHAGDMADFHLGQRYDLIVLGATSICLLLAPRQRAGLFACVREHLAEGGRFVFNVLDAAAFDGREHGEFVDVISRTSAQGQDFAILGQRRDSRSGHYVLNVYRERIGWDGSTVRSLGASVKARIERDELLGLIQASGLRLDAEVHDGAVAYYTVSALRGADTRGGL